MLYYMWLHIMLIVMCAHTHTVQRQRSVKLPGDVSVMTYSGHSVKNTLIRCHFSPSSTTGQVRMQYMVLLFVCL